LIDYSTFRTLLNPPQRENITSCNEYHTETRSYSPLFDSDRSRDERTNRQITSAAGKSSDSCRNTGQAECYDKRRSLELG